MDRYPIEQERLATDGEITSIARVPPSLSISPNNFSIDPGPKRCPLPADC
jgi:hypothetical protein